MRKIFFFTLFFIGILAFPLIPVYAFDNWVKSESNPLPFSSTFNESHRNQPFTNYENGVYKMWYTSIINNQNKIGYATSEDGLHWTTHAILHPHPQLHNHDPHVIATPKGKILFFAGTPGWGIKIYKVNLTDDSNFDPDSLKEIITPTLWWEGGAVSEPAGIFEEEKYYLFYTAHSGIWRLGMAYSSDGENWTKCQNPILKSYNQNEAGGGPFIFKKDGKYYLFYHSPDASGIKLTQSDGPLSCNMSWSTPNYILFPDKDYDQSHMVAPSVFEKNNQLFLYYGGIGPKTNGHWVINLATSELTSKKTPIIFLPGLLASWNKQAIIYNQPVNLNDWQINPFVKEYNGIINTFKNLDYKENKELFIFAYDWRKSLDNLADNLNNFIEQLTADNQQFNLIGHSLGGLVSRIYAQKYGIKKIDKLITVGSPHKGATQAYKAVEAGELEEPNTYMWLAQKLLLNLYRDGIKTDKQIIEEKFPVLKDLFPIYNFLRDENNQEIKIEEMKIKNDTLLNYSPSFSQIFPILTTVVGETGNTISGYKVGGRTIFDQLLDFYPDGRPVEKLYQPGDLTVLTISAQQGNNSKIFNLNHEELIYKKETLSEILNLLTIPHQDSQIIEGSKTKLSPSLIFLIFSPATMEVTFNQQTYSENQGLIFIEDPPSGQYLLKITGVEKGRYTVLVGQIGYLKDVWSKIEGEITKEPPTSQIDTYLINFNSQSPLPIEAEIEIDQLFDELILYFNDFKNKLSSGPKSDVIKALTNLNLAKNYFKQENKGKLKSSLLITHQHLFAAWKKITNLNQKYKLLYGVEKLENLYQRTLANYNVGIFPSRLEKDLEKYKQLVPPIEKYLLFQKQKGQEVTKNVQILLQIENRLTSAEEQLAYKNYNFIDIILKSIKELVKEVRQIN